MLTEKQKQTLKFIENYFELNETSPTEREIAEGIGITSRGVVHRYIKALCDAGFIRIEPKRWRNIQIVNQTAKNNQLTIPILGRIAAGSPIEAIQDPQDINLSESIIGENRYLLEVKGDSMIGDNICDGDYIICERCSISSTGSIVVVLIDKEEATLKRYKRLDDNTIALIPSNPEMSPMIYEASRITIQARYLGLLRLNNIH